MKENDYLKNGYVKYNKKHKRQVRGIYFLAIFVLISGICSSWVLFKNILVAVMVATICALYMILMYVQYRSADIFISNIVKDLSQILEQLMLLREVSVFPCNDDTLVSKLQNQIIRLVHILKRENEREKLEHENIKHLVSDLSHQLKTPLANLKMYIEFLKNDDITNEQKSEYLNVLEISLERLLFLSESMIKVSRLESGLIQLECKESQIAPTVLKAIKDAYAKAKFHQIEIQYEEEFQGDVLHDSKWTAEAIYNLIDNAIKYGKAGNIIKVRIRELGMMIEISVEDQNTPIKQSEYNSIFERFYRGEGSGNIEGVGIGLYLTREIIEKQRGYVVVKPGEIGNRFVMVLQRA